MRATKKKLTDVQDLGLTSKFLPPNVKKLDHPPSKKNRVAAPEVHIAVNIAPTPGVGGAAMPGSYVVSSGSASAPGPGPLCPENISNVAAHTDAPAPTSTGHRVYIPQSRKTLLLTLLDCTQTGRLPSVRQLLELMDSEEPEPDGRYIDVFSDMDNFGLEDVLDIYEMEDCYLGTFGDLGRGGAQRLRRYT
jgi:hypothetical protein